MVYEAHFHHQSSSFSITSSYFLGRGRVLVVEVHLQISSEPSAMPAPVHFDFTPVHFNFTPVYFNIAKECTLILIQCTFSLLQCSLGFCSSVHFDDDFVHFDFALMLTLSLYQSAL